MTAASLVRAFLKRLDTLRAEVNQQLIPLLLFFSSGMWGKGEHTLSLSTPINPLPNSLKQTSPHTFTCEWWQCAICLRCTIKIEIWEEPELGQLHLTTVMFELQAHCSCCWQKGFGETPVSAQPVSCRRPQYLSFSDSTIATVSLSQTGSFHHRTYRWIIPKSDGHNLRRELFGSSSHIIIIHRGWPLASLHTMRHWKKCWKYSRALAPTVTFSWK